MRTPTICAPIHDVRRRIAQRRRPPSRVVQEERLQRAGNEVCARQRSRHHVWRPAPFRSALYPASDLVAD